MPPPLGEVARCRRDGEGKRNAIFLSEIRIIGEFDNPVLR